MTAYQTTVGVEVHVELTTRSKMFCPCRNAPQDLGENQAACPVCLGLPGALPSVNREALRLGLVAALALNCRVNPRLWFERKNYIYPDLVKGYQISQYAMPLGEDGWLTIPGDSGEEKRVDILRVHLEEDTAKLIHANGETLVDVNRSGAPLMEIVTRPVLSSGREAEEYVRKLRAVLVYHGVSRCRIQLGEMRVEANVSIAPPGATELGIRTEIKNQAGFNHMRGAIEYEVRRHAEVLDSGGRIRQETRGWDDANQKTFVQRSKEDAHDYRYFPEPDLPPVVLPANWVEEERSRLPEPYDQYLASLARHGVSPADRDALSRNDALSFLAAAARPEPESTPRLVKRLVTDVFGIINATGVRLEAAKLDPENFRQAVSLQTAGRISAAGLRTLLEKLYREGGEAGPDAARLGLLLEDDSAAVLTAVETAIAASPGMLAEFRAGKVAVRNALLGKTMKALKAGGKTVDPRQVGEVLDRALQS
ncbi:MAG: Asp-tRNA(Asn)/Glu-tRNA(Gln) amidotransferase subunit GatB [Planctomycetota bacterium]|jgi:aspartyl-tRNA(Asn)/glutamyl-tRNA(Gln) amidotransferase subunit B|nr:Asp-tRNA(Asn)/Glu-tRNA(Gln) amidotransferase subunit GatB [Planctomycetota bacterium]